MFIACPLNNKNKCAHCATKNGDHSYEENVDIKLLYCGSNLKGMDKNGLHTNKIKDMIGCPKLQENRYKYKKIKNKVLR
jgi:hypothetical protein